MTGLGKTVALVAPELSLLDMQILMLRLLAQQEAQQLLLLAAIEFTNGLATVRLRSKERKWLTSQNLIKTML
jgi:hypothetical protein